MDRHFYQNLADRALSGQAPSDRECREILRSKDVELMPLVNAAFEVRACHHGREVTVHIINNAQNGFCPEDCHYCAQAKTAEGDIPEYSLKPEEEILAEARQAYERGAFRYCMVFAGRGPNDRRVKQLAGLIRKIKASYPLEVCVSAGLLDEDKARVLKEAGLDRLNHNLNTSERHYSKICTTHTYAERLATLKAASSAGLELCSGIIVGMGEEDEDVIDVARTLREQKVQSIPVNFFVPVPGNIVRKPQDIEPQYGLRVLCLYRFLNPSAEIRVAAGREIYFRSMEVLTLYPANSLFLEGYLNTRGSPAAKTLRMIRDAGFTLKSDHDLNELLEGEKPAPVMKDLADLRPLIK